MAKTITPVSTLDTFETWVTQTNSLIDTLATEILTANNNANGAFVTGNSQLFGIFTANTVAVFNELRGGNVQASAALLITSDVTMNTGNFALGVSDSVPGVLDIFGGGTGEISGAIRIYNNADDDTNADYWLITGEDGTGDFIIGDPGDQDVLRIDETTFMTTLGSGLTVTTGGASISGSILHTDGNLTIDRGGDSQDALLITNTDVSFGSYVYYRVNNINRWGAGRQASGNNYQINRYNTAGTFQDASISIEDTTGLVTIANGLTVTTGVTTLDGGLVETSGSVDIGVNDTTPGFLSIYGGGTGELGARLRLYNDADQDTTVDYWRIEADSGGNLIFGNDIDSNIMYILQSGNIYLATGSGGVYVGEGDAVPGILRLLGGGTGESSGALLIYNNADDDTNADYWQITGEDGTGDFTIGDPGKTDALRIDETTFLTTIANGVTISSGILTLTSDWIHVDDTAYTFPALSTFEASRTAGMVVASQDAGVIIVSNDAATWGSELSLKEGNTSAVVDNWAWIRQTTVGGDASLRATYGTNNDSSLNPAALVLSSSLGLTVNNGFVVSSGATSLGGSLTVTSGEANVGVNDTTPGILRLFGGGTTEVGGRLYLYNAVDHDTNADYWLLQAADGTGDFLIGDPGKTDVLRIDETTFLTTIANGITVTTGITTLAANLDLSGTARIILDADNDSYIYASADDTVQFYTGAAARLVLNNTTADFQTTAVRTGGDVFIDTDTGDFRAGAGTSNLVANSSTIQLANSTVTFNITKPTAAEVTSGDYFLGANGIWQQAGGGGWTEHTNSPNVASSGNVVSFTGMPAGVQEVKIVVWRQSATGGTNFFFRLANSTGEVNTGYYHTSYYILANTINSGITRAHYTTTTPYLNYSINGGDNFGQMHISRVHSTLDVWTWNGMFSSNQGGSPAESRSSISAGSSPDIGGDLDGVVVRLPSGDTFSGTGGYISVFYK